MPAFNSINSEPDPLRFSLLFRSTMTMPNDDYIPLPTEYLQLDVERETQLNPKPRPHRQASGPTILQGDDSRFNPPTPSPLKRAALLLFVFGLFWFALKLRTTRLPQPPLVFETERYFSGYTDCDACSQRPAAFPQTSTVVQPLVMKGSRTHG